MSMLKKKGQIKGLVDLLRKHDIISGLLSFCHHINILYSLSVYRVTPIFPLMSTLSFGSGHEPQSMRRKWVCTKSRTVNTILHGSSVDLTNVMPNSGRGFILKTCIKYFFHDLHTCHGKNTEKNICITNCK